MQWWREGGRLNKDETDSQSQEVRARAGGTAASHTGARSATRSCASDILSWS